MKNNKTVKTICCLIALIILLTVIILFCGGYVLIRDLMHVDLDELPIGKVYETITSPTGEYTFKVYLVSLNALSQYGYRGEVVFNSSGVKKTIYFEYPINHNIINAEWNGSVITVNGISLDVLNDDVYDSRKNVD